MEEEKAAAYYEELTRKGEGAARFKQGLGFSSNTPDPITKGSSFSSSSFLSSFVKATSPTKVDKQVQLENIQNKLKKKDGNANEKVITSSRRRMSRERERGRRRRSRSRGGRRSRSASPMGRRRVEKSSNEGTSSKEKVDYSRLIKGYEDMAPAERVKAKMKLQLSQTGIDLDADFTSSLGMKQHLVNNWKEEPDTIHSTYTATRGKEYRESLGGRIWNWLLVPALGRSEVARNSSVEDSLVGAYTICIICSLKDEELKWFLTAVYCPCRDSREQFWEDLDVIRSSSCLLWCMGVGDQSANLAKTSIMGVEEVENVETLVILMECVIWRFNKETNALTWVQLLIGFHVEPHFDKKQGIQRKVGIGLKKTLFWQDVWSAETSLANRFPVSCSLIDAVYFGLWLQQQVSFSFSTLILPRVQRGREKERADKDPDKGMGAGWERFEFNKDAPLDDEEIEVAEDDAVVVKKMSQSFRFSAVEARREEQIKAAHDEAMFGELVAQPSMSTDEEVAIEDDRTDNAIDQKATKENGVGTNHISDKVLAKQQGSWRDRARKL
ncbi:hypothetical protein IFM89_029491 [Coptis chinensis]|uniref:Uncharacterized protein n=1 Tax=Coptis chinensis TaxID=261450 RepID=A0A835LVU2_9MAGN|nr:hypothetical protein IFM89_029491 [Coptis chinensis]